MFFDHVEVDSDNFSEVARQYAAVLPAILGCEVSIADEDAIFSVGEVSFFLIRRSNRKAGVHLAFRVESRDTVDRAYALALESGFLDNGSPGLRDDYGPNYYAAFVLDGDQNNIEFLCRAKQAT